MATNELLRFANGEAANVVTFQDWLGRSEVTNGFVAGIARSAHMNRIFAQGALASYVMGQLIVSQLNKDAKLEDQDFYTNFLSALVKYVPANVADGSINGAKILNASLNAAKIVDATITAAKLANKTISTAKIADLAITAAQIASKTITQTQIADATLTFAKIATEAIATSAEAKAGEVNNKLMTPQLVAQAIAQLAAPLPTGAIVPMIAKSVPAGYLQCDGSQLDHGDAPTLCELLWLFDEFKGDSTSYAVLPDLDGRVMQGVTSIAQVGTYLEPRLPNITGSMTKYQNLIGQDSQGAFYLSETTTSDQHWHAEGTSTDPDRICFDASRSNEIYSGISLQPNALQVLCCIKT